MQCGFLSHLGSPADFTSESASHVRELDFCLCLVKKRKDTFCFWTDFKASKMAKE